MKLGFIGLGQMGRHMALNLSKYGDKLIVCDKSSAAFPMFEAKGIEVTTNQVDLADCPIIFLCLPNTEVVTDVINHLSPLLQADQIIVDMSTIDYTASVELAKSLKARNVEFIDAPVTGMEARAIDATLTIMCGGNKDTYETVLPYFKFMGNNVLHMGAHGAGQLTKTINNILFDINIAGLAEVLPMAVKLGLDPESIGAVVNSGSGRSYASEFFIPRILAANFKDGYPLKHAYKDLVAGATISANHSIPLPVTHAATSTYQMALLKGLGDKDKGAMIEIFEELLDTKFRKKS
ncbi:MAG: NAD(P)-dependent oxidoreductase [Sporomusaceae bacterium]|nr:NAD(P)-dependent oxidoreductase [Sporomusaceae bacterium]